MWLGEIRGGTCAGKVETFKMLALVPSEGGELVYGFFLEGVGMNLRGSEVFGSGCGVSSGIIPPSHGPFQVSSHDRALADQQRRTMIQFSGNNYSSLEEHHPRFELMCAKKIEHVVSTSTLGIG